MIIRRLRAFLFGPSRREMEAQRRRREADYRRALLIERPGTPGLCRANQDPTYSRGRPVDPNIEKLVAAMTAGLGGKQHR